jgi:hypothetical protein
LKNAKDILSELFIGLFKKHDCRPLAGNHEYSISSQIAKILLKLSDETRKPGRIFFLKSFQTLDDPFSELRAISQDVEDIV